MAAGCNLLFGQRLGLLEQAKQAKPKQVQKVAFQSFPTSQLFALSTFLVWPTDEYIDGCKKQIKAPPEWGFV